jgi:hypothetical protein
MDSYNEIIGKEGKVGAGAWVKEVGHGRCVLRDYILPQFLPIFMATMM